VSVTRAQVWGLIEEMVPNLHQPLRDEVVSQWVDRWMGLLADVPQSVVLNAVETREFGDDRRDRSLVLALVKVPVGTPVNITEAES
jgi:hypothetical protein